jgi:hypothetical protein
MEAQTMSGQLMSQKYPAAAAPYDPAMTFEEIGHRLGLNKKQVYFIFVLALKKLRRNPKALRELQGLIELRERERATCTTSDFFC